MNLWFVNMGGYNPNSMQESHEFGLVVASSKSEAKKLANSKWLIGFKKKHQDDIASLEMLISCDNCQLIKKIDKEDEIIICVDGARNDRARKSLIFRNYLPTNLLTI